MAVLQRCEQIHQPFRDPDVKAIICTIGGNRANELLRHLDYSLIQSNPKIFCGYSDITLLHYAIFTQTGLQTFYGPTAIPELGEYPEPFSFTSKNLLHVTRESAGEAVGVVPRSSHWAEKLPDFFFGDESSQRPRELSSSPKWIWLRSGIATGRIFGGCLPSVLRLSGTRFWPDYGGRVLFLENPMGKKIEDPFPLDDTRACMADLVNTGVFDEITGLIVGRPYGYDEQMRGEFAQMIADQCSGTDFPILLNVDIGHTSPVLTIPMNALVSLDSEKDDFRILEPGVLGN